MEGGMTEGAAGSAVHLFLNESRDSRQGRGSQRKDEMMSQQMGIRWK